MLLCSEVITHETVLTGIHRAAVALGYCLVDAKIAAAGEADGQDVTGCFPALRQPVLGDLLQFFQNLFHFLDGARAVHELGDRLAPRGAVLLIRGDERQQRRRLARAGWHFQHAVVPCARMRGEASESAPLLPLPLSMARFR